jgi:hypothetical protein
LHAIDIANGHIPFNPNVLHFAECFINRRPFVRVTRPDKTRTSLHDKIHFGVKLVKVWILPHKDNNRVGFLPEGHVVFPWPACPEEGRALSREPAKEKVRLMSAPVCGRLRLNKNKGLGERALFRNENKGWIDIGLPFLY